MSALALGTLPTDLDFGDILEAAVLGAVSAVAFAFGETAACPEKNALDGLLNDVVWGVFGAILGESLNQLTANPLLTAIITGFIAGFLVILLSADGGTLTI